MSDDLSGSAGFEPRAPEKASDNASGYSNEMGREVPRTYRRWTTEDIEFLKLNYATMTAEELATELGRSWDSVRNMVKTLKMRKRQEKVRECDGCHVTTRIWGRNLCKRCYHNNLRHKVHDLWLSEKRLAGYKRPKGASAEKLALSILEYEGFKDIWHISKEHCYFFCDYIANKEGRQYLIDVTTYTSKTISPVLLRFAARTRLGVMILFISLTKRRYYLMPNNDFSGSLGLSLSRIQHAKPFPPSLL